MTLYVYGISKPDGEGYQEIGIIVYPQGSEEHVSKATDGQANFMKLAADQVEAFSELTKLLPKGFEAQNPQIRVRGYGDKAKHSKLESVLTEALIFAQLYRRGKRQYLSTFDQGLT